MFKKCVPILLSAILTQKNTFFLQDPSKNQWFAQGLLKSHFEQNLKFGHQKKSEIQAKIWLRRKIKKKTG